MLNILVDDLPGQGATSIIGKCEHLPNFARARAHRFVMCVRWRIPLTGRGAGSSADRLPDEKKVKKDEKKKNEEKKKGSVKKKTK